MAGTTGTVQGFSPGSSLKVTITPKPTTSSSSSGGSSGGGSGSSPPSGSSSSSSSGGGRHTSRVTINLNTGGQSGVVLGSTTTNAVNEPTRTTQGETVTRVGGGSGSGTYVTSSGRLMNLTTGIAPTTASVSQQLASQPGAPRVPPVIDTRYELTNLQGETVNIAQAKNAREAFTQAGYSPVQEVGRLNLERPKTQFITRRKSMEDAGSITVYKQTLVARNAAEARLAGLPEPGTYEVISDQRVYTPRESIVTKLNKDLATRIELAGQTHHFSISSVSHGVEDFGKNVRQESDALLQGIKTTPQDKGLLTRYSPQNLKYGSLKVLSTTGGIIETVGKDIRERPVTFGAVAASGAVFKIGDAALVSLRASRALEGTSLFASTARGTITVGRGAAIGGLGAVFVGQTGAQLIQAKGDTKQTGEVIARTTEDVAAFSLGMRGASIGLEKGKPIIKAVDKEITTTGQALLESRAGTIGGRSAKQRAGRISAAEQRQRKGEQNTQFKLSATSLPRIEEPVPQTQTLYSISGKGVRREAKRSGEVFTKFIKSEGADGTVSFRLAGKKIQTLNGPIEVQSKEIPFSVAQPRERYQRSQLLTGLGKKVKLRPNEFIFALKETKPLTKPQPFKPVTQNTDIKSSSSVLVQKSVADTTNVYATVGPGEAAVRRPTQTIVSQGVQLPRIKRGQGYVEESPTGFSDQSFRPQGFGREPIRYGSPDYRRLLALERLRLKAEARKAELEQPLPIEKPSIQNTELKQPAKGKVAIRSSVVSIEKIGQGASSTFINAKRPVNAQDFGLINKAGFSLAQTSNVKLNQAQESAMTTRQSFKAASFLGTASIQENIPKPVPELITRPISKPSKEPVFSFKASRLSERYFNRETIEKKVKEKPKKLRPNNMNGSAGFNVLVRTKGKFKKINTGLLTGTDALELGAKKVKGSLAASFKVVDPTGKSIDTRSALGSLGSTFRSAKRDTTTFVQKAPFRLSSREERTSIQAAKKNRFGGFRL